MQPMGNERPGAPNYGSRPPFPIGAPPQTTIPSQSPGPGPVHASDPSFIRPVAPPWFGGPPSMVPPTSSYPSYVGQNQRFPSPPYPSSAQTINPSGLPAAGQVTPPPVTHFGVNQAAVSHPPMQQVLTPPPPAALRPQVQTAPVPMGPPPVGANFMQPREPAPSSFEPAFPVSRPVSQPPMQQYPFRAPQAGYVPPPPMVNSLGQSPKDSIQGGFQALVEEFLSLSVAPTPGSMDSGIDSKSLPRPFDGDAVPSSFSEMYPLNCHSRYLRLTTSVIPNSQSLLSRWHLPLGAVVHPLAEPPDGEEVPVINFGPTGIIRCRRCRTYINPYVTFTDGGRKWRCNICALFNDVPGDYFAHLDANGRRSDIDQRPELSKGSVEFVAPTEYMVRPPMPPLYFFLIDVSLTAVRSGMLEIAANTIKACLNNLPGFPRTQIGFITFDSTLHFYNMKSTLMQPQLMVVADLDDIFLPLPDDLLVNLSESRAVVDAFLDSLPSMFQGTANVESAFGPAVKAAQMVMSQLGGKLLIFQSSLPSLGIGRLKLRGDDMRIYGTDKEHTVRIPEDPFYKQMAAELVKFQIAVNLYLFNDKYGDIASLGALAKYTGGQVNYYPSFQGNIHKEKFKHELMRDLTRETAWEAVMRVRCGKGVRFTTYHGHFMLRSSDLMALPAVDCDKAFAMQLALEETLLTTQTVYFQVALLYTSSSGERRIRVHTAAAPVVADLGEMYRHADTGAIVTLLSRMAVEKTLTSKLEDARQTVQLKIVKSLKEYRNLYAVQHRLTGRLIYPDSLKYLPLYALALCKSIPLRGGYADAQLDERCAAGYNLMVVPISRLLKLLYPSLFRIDDYLLKGPDTVDDYAKVLQRVPLTADSLDPRGLFLYDDGFRFIIWFGKVLSSDIIANIIGADAMGFGSFSEINLTEQNNQFSRKLFLMLKKMRENDPSFYQHCHIVRQGEQPREGSLLLLNLVEDQIGGTSGYVDWIVQIHRQVQQGP
ncbi:protein transport protein Sec24-like At3g07100 isoform X1 [Nymphaea colorata]|uniref:protein transport protein Sec24-like At3g07100 isoform X1 n=1 Tax=Nymphaea colorata TaxID=210225 RepID=UPI00129DC759|nr:protein transport protein Sec24-like At3g07100 isoform X1 [Nymphaea colorata]XP_031503946.1 protein transport protein Sec24-like At3g07100 isoform X1 [Nymphaea colorata]XP_031503948.1 protein transport protein Sec24-like At3g07100 isoform X1 [Nymphaea colorata]XP_031503949.1 protein transport protein Sec24-like At3g07100 isoform X1 [Nymphaea colorata]XP_031503950.1 protein transport protein Sec24-like At3g07100 isoform X1 [Nymphaea colorata]XP_031503951.1 protein transport protein Sec24-lik